MYLDTLTPLHASVGYGALGCGGDLGYEGRHVSVGDRRYDHALGTHPPARLAFDVAGRYRTFRCKVAMNDSVPRGRSHADFYVHIDGRVVASAQNVGAGAGVRELVADISGARRLELSVKTSRWEYAHAVWLDPFLDTAPLQHGGRLIDPLQRAEITRVAVAPAELCIGTVVSPGFEIYLDDMLGSLVANGNCPDARIVVFAVNANDRCAEIAAKYNATLVPCRALTTVTASIKSVLYSMASIVEARHYVGLDADVLITGDLRPLAAGLDVLPENSILVARDGNGRYWENLGHGFRDNYCGRPQEIPLLQLTENDLAYPFMVNDGVFAASRCAMLALESQLRSIANAPQWLDATPLIGWRNQFLFNLALARLDAGVELDGRWNVQMHANDVEWDASTPRLRATWQGNPAHIVHFSGTGKPKYLPLQGRYANIARPLVGPTPGDGYAQFLTALRAWVGGRGIDVLAWSFYGTTDGQSGIVRDASVLPLFATLHYLVRSNGAVRVLETGTARGVSAACLAAAVAHREGGRVVTMDLQAWPDREELWRALPGAMQAVIEPRTTGSVEGMRAALDAGERYDVALLDTLHTEEHVWAEFDLARQLVCPGGLILIHDPLWRGGTVEAALRRIEREGYGVVRLWSAEGGVREDDELGLALIENRRRS
jgi:predicted O-methyltransferase YrrM